MWPLVRQARYLGRYREIAQVLVHHGFGYLVDQLGLTSLLSLPRRLIMRAPAPPPPGNAARLREALVELGPTFVKLGQALSTRPDLLPVDVVTELSKLQDTVPPFPGEQAVKLIETAFGQPINRLFSAFEREPFAAASLGQVHAAVLPDGTPVVVKVQRPDIASRIQTDLAILADLAALAQERITVAAQYNLTEIVWEFSATLRAELDYVREGRNAERFRQMFCANPHIYIPRVYWEYTDSRVLTTERIFGIKLNDMPALRAAGVDLSRLARASVDITLEEIFTHGFFHSDPHPGNFFVIDGAVLGVVDFGQVGILDQTTMQGLLWMMGSLINYDSHGLLRALERLGVITRRAATLALRRDLERFVEGFVDRQLGQISARETFDGLTALLRRHRLIIPGPLATLLKTIVMMEGLGMQLDPTLDVFSAARPYIQRALQEQFTPAALGAQALTSGRELGELALEIPEQLNQSLQRLNEGELRLQTRELELRRVAMALIGAANRLALALVVAAFILGVAALVIAMRAFEWYSLLPWTLLFVGIGGVVTGGILLTLALLRRE
ncbi:ABC1 kinase family protein [Chloroflexus sp.]|uniref:ABC1 kinase family protein n=1 Tax=Chloroflexus sp. TaxID=1904827 RepID=UPI0026120F4B|nr:lipopolysaccharide core heptose(II) kinase RfaY [uncultured Chloroflexus sp.]